MRGKGCIMTTTFRRVDHPKEMYDIVGGRKHVERVPGPQWMKKIAAARRVKGGRR